MTIAAPPEGRAVTIPAPPEGRAVTILIVDDEPLARRRLRRIVEQLGETVVGEAGDADAALALVAHVRPDVLLLDIQMPGRDGIALARELADGPAIIFTTAHGQFAVDAFDAAAVDYLLKPIESAKLARALERARKRVPQPPRITARAGDVTTVIAIDRIARFHAEHKYTSFVVDGVEHLIEVSLAELETRLAPFGFVRVHRAELVQVAKIRALHGAVLLLATGESVKVSRRALPEVRRFLTTTP
jgi:DNA-binding LytR/AlgR family response regulator